jgi:sporulation protein YlmC with PRC-barrel domain
MATTALATLLVSGAYAQDTTAPAETTAPAVQQTAPAAIVTPANGILATNTIGESVYNGTADDAESIGKVSDVVFDEAGKAKAMVIGVGGFLGLGEKKVAYDFSKLQWAEKNGDRWLVAETTKDELTAQPAFDPAPYEPTAAQAPADTTTTAPADTAMAPAAPADGTAQTETAPADTAPVVKAQGNLASQILGEKVYNGTGDDAENIGNVNDIVVANDGQAQSLIIGVGGFLGLGQKSVAFDYDKVQWATKDNDRWLVVQGSKEELTALPAFDRKAYDPAPAAANGAPAPAASNDVTAPAPMAAAPADTTTAAPSTDTAQEAPATDATADATQTAAIDKSTLTEMPVGDITSEELVGTTVYGADDANVGEIGDVALSADGKVDAVIVDVGGFLGMGEKNIAVGMDNLKFMTDKDGNKYLYTSFTKDQLEKQTPYDKGSYAEKRDDQRMMLQ